MKRGRFPSLSASIWITISLFVIGCHWPVTKTIKGGWRLENFETGLAYYVGHKTNGIGPGGVFEGAINQVGWNDNWLVADVTRVYRGDPDGWYALNLQTGEVIGPFESSGLTNDSRFNSITIRSPKQIFQD